MYRFEFRKYLEGRNFNVSHRQMINGKVIVSSLVSKAVQNNESGALNWLLKRGADVNYV
jgi:hypothetical protein